MSILYDSVKQIVAEYDGAAKRAGVLFGTVASVGPLSVILDNKLTLTDQFLTVAQHITDYDIPFELNQRYLSNELTQIQKTSGFFAIHEGKQPVGVENGYIGDYIGQGTIRLLNHLLVGDRVIVLRMENGNQYVIIDRIGEKDN